MALGVFPKRPDETEALAEVTLEGPAGVIMRMAREAKAARSSFGPGDVTSEMRAPFVHVTSEVKRSLKPADAPVFSDPNATPTPAPTPTPAAATPSPLPTTVPGATVVPLTLAPPMAVRLRSRILTEVMLRPIASTSSAPGNFTAPPLARATRRVDRFDLDAFRNLPGPDVEVVVRSATGPRYCTIAPKDRQIIR